MEKGWRMGGEWVGGGAVFSSLNSFRSTADFFDVNILYKKRNAYNNNSAYFHVVLFGISHD